MALTKNAKKAKGKLGLGTNAVRAVLAAMGVLIVFLFFLDSHDNYGYLVVDNQPGDMFGSSIDIDNNADVAVVSSMMAAVDSAPLSIKNAGLVSVFHRVEGAWQLQQSISASDASTNDNFGFSVAVHHDTIAVGSWHADIEGVSDAGAVYLFRLVDGQWVEDEKLVSPTPQEKAHFGVSVALGTGSLVVGAQKSDDISTPDISNTGSAYIFERDDGNWSLKKKLLPLYANENQFFGRSVALQDGLIAVGSPKKTVADNENAGAVYVYSKGADGNWLFSQLISSDNNAKNKLFGESLALDGQQMAISAWHDDDNGTNSGAVYLFRRQDDKWQQTHKVKASDASAGDSLGFRIDLKDNYLLAGAHLVGDMFKRHAGAAYLFKKDGDIWSQIAKYSPKRSKSGAEFGRSVGLGVDSVLVGAEKSGARGGRSGDTYSYPLD